MQMKFPLSRLRPDAGLPRALLAPATACLLGLACVTAWSQAFARETPPEPPKPTFTAEITADQFIARVALLASDAYQGRETATEGGALAETYVSGELLRMGWEPIGGKDAGPLQVVTMPVRQPVISECFVELTTGDEPAKRFGDGPAALPFSFSAQGVVEGGVAFVGFGIRNAEAGYDDYAGIDVKGRVVLMLRHGPQERVEGSPWYLRDRSGMEDMAFTTKAAKAHAAGAVGVLMVNDYNHEQDQLPVTMGRRGGAAQSEIPVMGISRDTADALLAPTGNTLRQLQREIDADRKPHSRPVDGATVKVSAKLSSPTGHNVVVIRRGTDPELAKQAVLIGAHLDHVGLGFFGSPVGGGEIHNGADDNASGTAALLEVAEALAAGPPTRRTLIVAAWCAEEKGLIGSRHYAEEPLWPLEDTVVCLNLDMVGRYADDEDKDRGLIVGGAPTGIGLEAPLLRLVEKHELRLTQGWGGWEQSDHFSFYRKGMPALFFSTGLHADYHRPTDDWWKIEREGGARIGRMVAEMARELADADGRPEFKAKPPRPVLGVRLGDAKDRDGALIGFVLPTAGAARAGMQRGDIVIQFDGKPITSAKDLGAAISARKPGDVVDVVWIRADKQVKTQVTISGR